MNLQHTNVQFNYDGTPSIDFNKAMEVLQKWVSDQSLEGMLIDVVDYLHVPNGPGLALIGFEGDYYLNDSGLRYSRKAAIEGDNTAALKQAYAAAVTVCERLETELGVQFNRKACEVSINDRAIAPNTDETFESLKADLESVFTAELGSAVQLTRTNQDSRKLFAVTVEC